MLRERLRSLTKGPVFPEPLPRGSRSARWVGRRDSCLDYRQPFQTHKVAFTVFIFNLLYRDSFSIKHKSIVTF